MLLSPSPTLPGSPRSTRPSRPRGRTTPFVSIPRTAPNGASGRRGGAGSGWDDAGCGGAGKPGQPGGSKRHPALKGLTGSHLDQHFCHVAEAPLNAAGEGMVIGRAAGPGRTGRTEAGWGGRAQPGGGKRAEGMREEHVGTRCASQRVAARSGCEPLWSEAPGGAFHVSMAALRVIGERLQPQRGDWLGNWRSGPPPTATRPAPRPPLCRATPSPRPSPVSSLWRATQPVGSRLFGFPLGCAQRVQHRVASSKSGNRNWRGLEGFDSPRGTYH